MTYHIENAEEIDRKWFEGKNSLFITSGTSTPNEVVNEVIEAVKKIHGRKE
jgi:4-hydroxy-3-methylbut-2-enyl diphosphate reductase